MKLTFYTKWKKFVFVKKASDPTCEVPQCTERNSNEIEYTFNKTFAGWNSMPQGFRILFYLKHKHYELPWGHSKFFELDESHPKWKFGTSEEIIAAFFTKNTSKVWNLDHFTSPGFTQNSLFWLILFSKWNFDCSYLSWWVEFLPTESISKLSCYRRVCWYFQLVGTQATMKDMSNQSFIY